MSSYFDVAIVNLLLILSHLVIWTPNFSRSWNPSLSTNLLC